MGVLWSHDKLKSIQHSLNTYLLVALLKIWQASSSWNKVDWWRWSAFENSKRFESFQITVTASVNINLHHQLVSIKHILRNHNYHNAIPILDNRLSLWRSFRWSRCLRCSWPQENGRSRSLQDRKLQHRSTISSKPAPCPIYILLANTIAARSFRCPTLDDCGCTPKQTGCRTLPRWHDDVQWKHIHARAQSAEVQGIGPCYAVGRTVFDWWVGGAGVWKEDTVSKELSGITSGNMVQGRRGVR